jgi:large subunit ribosomal protein L15
MHLGDLKPAKGATKNRKRRGRGPGSGHGSTSTRGNKGAKAREGYSAHHWFEGGQMPLKRRLPKRGFTNIHAEPMEAVNLSEIERLGLTSVTNAILAEHGVVSGKARLKILGMGDLTRAVAVRVDAVSASAREKIEAAGGSVELIPRPKRPKRYKKKESRKTGA